MPVAGPIVLVVPILLAEEVEHVHAERYLRMAERLTVVERAVSKAARRRKSSTPNRLSGGQRRSEGATELYADGSSCTSDRNAHRCPRTGAEAHRAVRGCCCGRTTKAPLGPTRCIRCIGTTSAAHELPIGPRSTIVAIATRQTGQRQFA